MRAASFAGALALAVVSTVMSVVVPAKATILITADNGGRMGDYAERFVQVRQSGERVVIDGVCLSACTMVLGLVPRDRICATQRAVLGFHAAWQPDGNGRRVTSSPATQVLMQTYPPAVRAWIARRGGLTPKMIFMRGSELASVVAPCGSETRQASARPRRIASNRARTVRAGFARTTLASRQ
jgi:hypothetical protein